MNETQKPKRKYGNYCLRSANGEKKRKCHTGECVDKINKVPGAPSRRCRKGTRKCSDQRCYPFAKKSKNPIQKTPFKIIKNKPESLSSLKSSSGYGDKIHPFMEEKQEQEENQQEEQPEEQQENQQEEVFSQPKIRNSKRKKSKSTRNFTSHGKYGNKRKPFTIPPTESQQQEEIQSLSSKQVSLLDLPVINNTNKKRRKRKRRRISSKKLDNVSNIIYNPVSSPSPQLRAISVDSSSTQKVTPENEPILLLENGNVEEPVSEEEPNEEVESVAEEEPVELEQVSEEEPVELEEEEPVELEQVAEEQVEEEENPNAEEPVEVEQVEEEEPVEQVAEEEENPELQPIELLTQSSSSSPPRKSSSPVSVGSINSENSKGGKKHSKKHYKKKSKKHNKKQSKKKSKKHYKKKSKKRTKK